jgi:FkbH-like protein
MAAGETSHEKGGQRYIKCVAWDLDNTVWDGVLLEDGHVRLRPGVVEAVRALDERGILHSIASRNEPAPALLKLREFGLEEYFLYPQINWNSKAASVEAIARELNIGLDAVAFIDDQPFERDEVAFLLPQVLCLDAAHPELLPALPELNPPLVTEDARRRRLMYLSDRQRQRAEAEFVGSHEGFLATLDIALTIAPAEDQDLERMEELTLRTNQLNTTGYTYTREELEALRRSDRHKLFVASLEDRYGSYGKIGMALVECGDGVWTIKLLLTSCRVMSRGVGTVTLNYLMRLAREAGVRLRAEFIPNGRNRMMLVTYKFASFYEVETDADRTTFEHDLSHIPPFPEYMKLNLRA